MINRKIAARRKLLGILPRDTLEALSRQDRPHIFTIKELIDAASTEGWELDLVHDAVMRVFRQADPEGTDREGI